jgi:hypothetical protein
MANDPTGDEPAARVPSPATRRGACVRTVRRVALVLALTLALPTAASHAASRRACQRTCKRFARHCLQTTSHARRCRRLLHRLDGCTRRFAGVACDATPSTTSTTTPTSSTTTTTVAGSGGVVTVDHARAASTTVAVGGGALTTTAADGTVYALTVPPGALLFDTTITMTPIVAIAGSDRSGTTLGVDLQPSGLRLYEFAELRITPPQLGPDADVAGFSYEGDGEDLHRYPAVRDGGRIVLHVIHFSGAGADVCVELCPPPIVPPPPPMTESQLEQLIAALDPHDPFYAPRLAELLHAYYGLFIAPDLPLMEQSCEYATSRIPKALAWSRTNQLLLNEEGFEGENQTIGNSLVRSVSNCWSEATATCLDPNDAYRVQNLLQISRQAQLLGGDPEVFDPSTVRRCSGLWSGTVRQEWSLDEDADFDDAGHHTRRTRLRRTQTWRIVPHVIGASCESCPSRMFDATWSASASVDDLYVTDLGTCTDTVTQADEVEGGGSPSAFVVGMTPDQGSFYLFRATPGVQGAPPNGVIDKPYVSLHVDCLGNAETVPFASLHVGEDWTTWPFSDGLPLGRTDRTIPTTSSGEKVDRQERAVIGGVEVITTRWIWQLTIEPDAAQ